MKHKYKSLINTVEGFLIKFLKFFNGFSVVTCFNVFELYKLSTQSQSYYHGSLFKQLKDYFY